MTPVRDFLWGKVRQVHTVGEYEIVEFEPSQPSNPTSEGTDSPSQFHPYLDGRDLGRSYGSLDAALVAAIAIKRDGVHTRADEYFMRIVASR